MDEKPMVSVVMITYNHEKYIAEAMNGVFMQKCDFDIEFIIANDKSTDTTNRVINEIIDQTTIADHLKMRYYNHPDNKGMMKNFIWSLQPAKGWYITLCEGDDYWTDPLKLQKQVDFLEGNEEFNGVFTNIDLLTNSTFTKNALKSKHKKDLSLDSFFIDAWIRTLTILFKTNLIITLPENPKAVISGELFFRGQ
jgi:glycosyltransferase involved in cell wall biosynthesis